MQRNEMRTIKDQLIKKVSALKLNPASFPAGIEGIHSITRDFLENNTVGSTDSDSSKTQ